MRFFFLMAILFFPFSSYADTDGNFCIGKKYVAIDIRGMELPSADPIIRIVHIDKAGDLKLIDIPAQSISNRELSCQDKRVYLSNGFKVELNEFENPEFMRAKLPSGIKFSSLYLPFIRKTEAMNIPAEGFDSTYSLVLSYAMQTVSIGILHYNSARVVKVNRYGRFMESKLLAEGVRYESVD